MKIIISILITFIFLNSNAQKYKQLEGEWYTCNDDSIYYKSDTIDLYAFSEDLYAFSDCSILSDSLFINCNYYIYWNYNNMQLHITEDLPNNRIKGYAIVEKLILQKKGKYRYIKIKRGDDINECFKIISFTSNKCFKKSKLFLKHLQLKRISPAPANVPQDTCGNNSKDKQGQ